jgi:pyridoxal phosphate enzyme (YggS family)
MNMNVNMKVDAAVVARNIADVRATIAARTDRRVALVAVTKAFDERAVRAAIDAGADGIGENYAQEMVAKAEALATAAPDLAPVPWHFIGQLQRNKVRVVAPLGIALWETIDRPELAREIARRQPSARVLVQVNTTDEPQKGGCEPAAAPALVEECRALGLTVRGLMTVGPAGAAEDSRPIFRGLRRLADDLGLDECSMGMSGDFEVAVEEGATIVRIGSRLFGPRG